MRPNWKHEAPSLVVAMLKSIQISLTKIVQKVYEDDQSEPWTEIDARKINEKPFEKGTRIFCIIEKPESVRRCYLCLHMNVFGNFNSQTQ